MWVPFINNKLTVLGAASTGEVPVTQASWCSLCQVIKKEAPQVATCFLKTKNCLKLVVYHPQNGASPTLVLCLWLSWIT